VTLLVTPENSQRLQLASSQGNIQFVLRSGADHEQAEITPTRLDQLFPSDKPPVAKAVKRTAHQAPPMYMMEVIQGTKRSEEKFQE
jgi:Flp pilus assembly protein CpaB